MEIIHDCLGGLSGQDHAVADDTEIVDEDPTEVWIKANGLEELFREA